MTDKAKVTAERIREAIKESKAASYTALFRFMGRSKPNSKAISAIKILVPEADMLLKNHQTPKNLEEPAKSRKLPKSGKSACPRHAKNPFREGSAYGLLVDLLAQAGEKGISRDDLLKDFCRITKKPLKNAKFDLQVILSAARDSEKLHRSCREGFSILREGLHYRIKFA